MPAYAPALSEHEARFYEDFERPEVLPYMVGFAGIDPCRRDGSVGLGDMDIAVDGGEITE